MASASPQLPPCPSIDPPPPSTPSSSLDHKAHPRLKNAWSQIVRGDGEVSNPQPGPPKKKQQPPPPPSQQQQQQPQRKQQNLQQQQHQHHQQQQQQRNQQQQPQHNHQQEQRAAPEADTASGTAAAVEAPPSSASPSGTLAPLQSEKEHVGDFVLHDPKTGIDAPDRSDADASSAESNKADAATTEIAAKAFKPAWRKPPANAGQIPESGAVMGAVSWPALADARATKSSEQPKQTSAPATGPKSAPKQSPASQSSEGSAIQGSSSDSSTHVGAGKNGSISPTATKQKSSFKRGITGNGMPTFSAPAIQENVPASFMGHSAPAAHGVPLSQSVKGSGEIRTKAVLANAANADHGRVFHHRGEGPGPFSNNAGNRRNNMRDQGRGNHGLQSHGRGYMNGRENGFPLPQQRVGPRNLPRLTPFMNTNPAYINATGFQNARGGMYYMPAAAPDPVLGAAYFVPPALPGVLMPGPDLMTLRVMLLKQIEYYFSVQNLCKDIYLRSNMDHQGFVPVSVIANFNRVRTLTLNPAHILEALRKSTVVEIQGDRIRKRDDWAKWILPSSQKGSVASSAPREEKKDSAKSYIPTRNAKDSDRANDQHNGATILEEETVPHPLERPEEPTALQESSVNTDPYLEPCTSEVRGGYDDGQATNLIERLNDLRDDTSATSSSLQAGRQFNVGNNHAHDECSSSISNDTGPLKESSTGARCIAGEETESPSSGNTLSPLTDGETFQLDGQLKLEHSDCRDSRYESNSHNNEDEDAELTDKDQPHIIVTQPPH